MGCPSHFTYGNIYISVLLFFLKSLLNLLQYCFYFMFCFLSTGGIWNLSSSTRDRTHIPCTGRQILNHWTTEEVLVLLALQVKTLNLRSMAPHSLQPPWVSMAEPGRVPPSRLLPGLLCETFSQHAPHRVFMVLPVKGQAIPIR